MNVQFLDLFIFFIALITYFTPGHTDLHFTLRYVVSRLSNEIKVMFNSGVLASTSGNEVGFLENQYILESPAYDR